MRREIEFILRISQDAKKMLRKKVILHLLDKDTATFQHFRNESIMC